MKTVVTTLFAAIALTACSQKHYEMPPVHFMGFEEEAKRIAESAPCEWIHGAADPQSVTQFDFGCHGGKWGTVSLYLDRKEEADDSVSRIRLLWKEKEPEYALQDNERSIAEEFVLFIARAYAPDYDLLRSVFMGTQQRKFSTTRLDFDYTYTQSEVYGLHRLEITENNPVGLSN